MSTIEESILVYLNTWAHGSRIGEFIVFTCAQYLIYIVFLIPVLFMLHERTKTDREESLRAIVRASLAVVFAWGVGFLIESIASRVRPYLVVPNIVPLASIPGNSSFPSGHTIACFAYAFSFLFFPRYRVLGAWITILSIFVGVGRVAAGLHYPTDVLIGMVIGIIVAFLLAYEGSPVFRWLLHIEAKSDLPVGVKS